MSVNLATLRQRHQGAFLNLVGRARELAGVPVVIRDDGDEIVQRRKVSDDNVRRLREEWDRAAIERRVAEEREEENRSWGMALLALITLFRSDPKHTPAF